MSTSAPPLTLVEFLTARLREREHDELVRIYGAATIQAAAHPNQRTGERLVICHDCDWFTEGSAEVARAATDQHLRDEHDDERVLADIAAKRAIIAEISDMLIVAPSGFGNDQVPINAAIERAAERARVLRLLASPYRDHPQWREEWA